MLIDTIKTYLKRGEVMRPIKLTISAFGPYASKRYDFEELKGRNIFVISGKLERENNYI